MPAEHNLRESLTEIDKSAGRATSLTRQLLAFSRNRLFEAKTVVIDDVIRDFEKMLRRIIGEDIELHFVLGANGDAIRTEAGPKRVMQELTRRESRERSSRSS